VTSPVSFLATLSFRKERVRKREVAFAEEYRLS